MTLHGFFLEELKLGDLELEWLVEVTALRLCRLDSLPFHFGGAALFDLALREDISCVTPSSSHLDNWVSQCEGSCWRGTHLDLLKWHDIYR